MATIGSLAVNLIARTEKFSGPLARARKDLGAFRTTANSVRSAVLGLGAALAGALAVHKLRAQAEALDKLAKASDKLGVSFEGLQRLREAGSVNDVGEGLLVRGLTEMQRRLEEGHRGLQQLGTDIRQLKSLNGEQAFLRIADAIAAMPDARQRIVAARGAFGKAGVEMLPFLTQGSAGINQAAAGASAISRAEAARVEEANDAITKVNNSFERLTRELTVGLAPAVTKIADLIADETKMLSGGNARQGEQVDRTARETRVRMLEKGGFGGLTDLLKRGGDAGFLAEVSEARNRIMQRDLANERTSASAVVGAPSRLVGGAMQRLVQLADDGADALGRLGAKARELERANFWAVTKQMFGLGPFRAAAGAGAAGPPPHDQELLARLQALGLGGGAEIFRGNAALERGTVAAFSQERRSQQQNQLIDEARKQTELQKKMVDHLKQLKGRDLGAQLLPANVV